MLDIEKYVADVAAEALQEPPLSAVDTFQSEIDAAVRTLNDAKVRVICHHVIIPAENDSIQVRRALDVIGMTFPRVRYYDGPEGGDE